MLANLKGIASKVGRPIPPLEPKIIQFETALSPTENATTRGPDSSYLML